MANVTSIPEALAVMRVVTQRHIAALMALEQLSPDQHEAINSAHNAVAAAAAAYYDQQQKDALAALETSAAGPAPDGNRAQRRAGTKTRAKTAAVNGDKAG
jgi:hypothetical protein